MSEKNSRPDFIKHYSEISEGDVSHYRGSDEKLAISSPFGKTFGLKRVGINHDTLKPGRRTSWPHAESAEEEFVYVITGTPDVWIDGVLYRLKPGHGVGFPPGTGVSHTFINNTETDVHLLVVGERRPENKCYYPLHPQRKDYIGETFWSDAPRNPQGPHDGLPDKLRK